MAALLHAIPWEAAVALAAAAVLLAVLPRIVRSAWAALGGRKRRASDWTRGQRLIACALAVLGTGITVPAFTEIYMTVTHLIRPAFGAWSWTVPVSGEIAFTYLFLNGVLLAMRRAPAGALRSVLIAVIIAGSVVLNIWAYLGSVPAVVGHLIIVAAFFGVLLAGKETVMTLRGGKVRADRITAGEWIAQPARSAALWRWMKTWGEPSRDAALERYMRLLYTRALAQSDPRVGRRPFAWRRNLPPPLRYQLSTGTLPLAVATGGDWLRAAEVHVAEQLALLPEVTPESTEEDKRERTGEDREERKREDRRERREDREQDKPEGNGWPETKDINRAVLMRRVRAACEKYAAANGGKRLPATQLSAALKVRMSRTTATALLAETYQDDQRQPAHRREG